MGEEISIFDHEYTRQKEKTKNVARANIFAVFNDIQFGVARVVQTTTPLASTFFGYLKGSKYITQPGLSFTATCIRHYV